MYDQKSQSNVKFESQMSELVYVVKNRSIIKPYQGMFAEDFMGMNLINKHGLVTDKGVDMANMYQSYKMASPAQNVTTGPL